MILARLSEINPERAAEAVELLFGSQITGNQSRDDIKEFISGRFFDNGRFMRVAIDDGRVVATGGAVVAEVERREIFITALTAATGFETLLTDMVRQIMADIAEFPDCLLRLGVKGDLIVPPGFPDSFGFRPSYSLLQMRFAGELPSESDLAHVELISLKTENLDEFVSVSNAGFAGTPNGATLKASDAQRMLANQALRCGLVKFDGQITGSYELKLNAPDGWIESVCLLPAWHGRGLGRAAVARLIYSLHQLGCETVKLTVVDSNAKAYRLYQRMGFRVDHVLARWFVKE